MTSRNKQNYFNAKILQLHIIFAVAFNVTIVVSDSSNSDCFWTPCVLSQDIKNTTDKICAPNHIVKIEQNCSIDSRNDNNVNMGVRRSCCLETRRLTRSSFVGKLYLALEVAKEVAKAGDIQWPDNDGAWQNVSLNCPFPPNISESVSQYPVKFFLYTRNNTNTSDFDVISDKEESLTRSGFVKGAPVKIITHGFLSNGINGPAMFLRESYNKLPQTVNIISVHWEDLASLTNLKIPCYNLAAEMTRSVGKQTAKLMKFLIEQNVTKIKDIHIMGHSLGAHCSAFTCKEFAKYSMGKCSRLTGFDPAGPSFTNVTASDRIDFSDADFVDIIHTAATDFDILPNGFGKSVELGILEAVGHSDFYPNDGGHQPGCEVLHYPLSSPACSHMRSYELYAASIQPSNVFKSTLCDTVQQAIKGECKGPKEIDFGEYTDINNSSRKIYYLETKGSPPFVLDNTYSISSAFNKFFKTVIKHI